MAYNENLADRLREVLIPYHNDVQEKHMFGGLAFMYRGKMCCGVVKNELMVRVVDAKMEEVLERNYAREMDFTKRPMKGFVFVEEGGFKTNQDLTDWVTLGIEHVEAQLNK